MNIISQFAINLKKIIIINRNFYYKRAWKIVHLIRRDAPKDKVKVMCYIVVHHNYEGKVLCWFLSSRFVEIEFRFKTAATKREKKKNPTSVINFSSIFCFFFPAPFYNYL